MPTRKHLHEARLIWTGNDGSGTASYAGYGRSWRLSIEGKHDLDGSAEPLFRGDPARLNPEDLFLASISSCHLLSYLALCALKGVRVTAYEDDAQGTMTFDTSGGGRFETVVLSPKVTIAPASDPELAESLHDRAHELCFIANSCSVPISVSPTVSVERIEASA
jgi:organic hydroperoxide reductase OsmC/OhrA